jgi:hypothetical protein
VRIILRRQSKRITYSTHHRDARGSYARSRHVPTSPGMSCTNFFQCLCHVRASRTSPLRRVPNAANMPCGENLASLRQRIALPTPIRLQYDVRRLQRYVYSHIIQRRTLWPSNTHKLEPLEIMILPSSILPSAGHTVCTRRYAPSVPLHLEGSHI